MFCFIYITIPHTAHQVITNLAASLLSQDCDFEGTYQMTQTEDTKNKPRNPPDIRNRTTAHLSACNSQNPHAITAPSSTLPLI